MPTACRVVLLFAGLLSILPGQAADPVAAPAAAPKAGSPPTAIWARDPGFRDVKLSPDGKRIALRYHDPEGARVATLTVPDLKVVGGLKMEPGRSIVDIHWTTNRELVAEMGIDVGPVESAAPTGVIFAFDDDGKDATALATSIGTSVHATIHDALPNDRDHILILTERSDRARSYQTLQRFNIRSAHRVELAVAPEYGPAEFVRDAAGEVRYVTVWPDTATFGHKSWRRDASGEWQALPIEPGLSVRPVALSKDGAKVYRLVSRDGGPWCLDRQTLATGAVESLLCDPQHSVLALVHAFDGSGEPIGALIEPGRSELRVLPGDHPDRALLKLAIDAFPGKRVWVASASLDGSTVLLRVDDDRTPGDWYLFDTAARKIDYLLGQQEWLDPEWMGERRPLNLKARDGTLLQAYLTLPPGRPAKDLPLVVWPHGGPLWVRDGWTFDQEPQLLATHGYAVLQVNFRGSDGRGPGFIDGGRQAWGTTMIDDLTDAVRATVASGVVDGRRICIGGWSYGGYAALMSAVREPDLYRCVVGAAGVYDLEKDRDSLRFWQGRRYYDEAVGADDAVLRGASPIRRLDMLRAPVLIVHGGEDQRVRVSQARDLRKALERKQHPHKVLIIDEEGHGFRKQANVQRYYDTLLAFLAQHLQPAAAPAPASAP